MPDIINYKEPFIAVLCAAPKCGKSHMIKYIIKKLVHGNHVDFVIAFSGTAFTGDYDYLPDEFVPSYSDRSLKKVMRYIRESGKKAAIVFDDMLGSPIKWDSKLLTHIITTYRHYGLRILIATQYINKIPPTIRESARYAILFRQKTDRARQAIKDSYGEDRLCAIPSNASEKYTSLVCDQTEDKTAKFKAPKKVSIQVNGFNV